MTGIGWNIVLQSKHSAKECVKLFKDAFAKEKVDCPIWKRKFIGWASDSPLSGINSANFFRPVNSAFFVEDCSAGSRIHGGANVRATIVVFGLLSGFLMILVFLIAISLNLYITRIESWILAVSIFALTLSAWLHFAQKRISRHRQELIRFICETTDAYVVDASDSLKPR